MDLTFHPTMVNFICLFFLSCNTISLEGISQRQQAYHNPHKSHSFQHPIPAQSVYVASPPVTRNGIFSSPPSSLNVYNFNQNHSPRNRQSKHHPNRPNVMITTYL